MFHQPLLGPAFSGFPTFMHKDLVPIGPFSATLPLATSQIRPIFPEVSVRASRKCLGSCMVESFEGSSVCVCAGIFSQDARARLPERMRQSWRKK
jgi:hypothetical protein